MDLDTKVVILSAFVQKLWLKTYFCKMVATVMRSGTSHVQTAQDFYNFCKGPYSSYYMLQFGDILKSTK